MRSSIRRMCSSFFVRLRTRASRAGWIEGRERSGKNPPAQLRTRTVTGAPVGPPGGSLRTPLCGPCHTGKKDEHPFLGTGIGLRASWVVSGLPVSRVLNRFGGTSNQGGKSQVGEG